MRKNATLSALKQNFSDKFLIVFLVAFVAAIFMGIAKPSLDLASSFIVLFVLIMAAYLVFSVKLWQLLMGREKITTIEQAEEASKKLAFLKEEKAKLWKKRNYSLNTVNESRDKLEELQEKKKKFGNLVLNATNLRKAIRLEKWSINYYSKEARSLAVRIEEINDEINWLEKSIERSIASKYRLS